LNARAEAWMAEAKTMIAKAIIEQQWQTTLRSKVIVEVKTYWSSWAVQDTHNLYKLLMDAMESAGVFDNDRFALVNQVDFEKDATSPRVELRVYVKEVQGVLPPPSKAVKAKAAKKAVTPKKTKKKTEVKQ
jgi:Holliday junction resolvase RusA-like endonuclease